MAFYSKIDTAKKNRLGTLRKDYAGNVYVYGKGVSSLAAGDWVTYDEVFAPSRLVGNAIGPVAISMSANTSATNYSWFQVWGNNTIAKTDTVLADKPLFIDGTTGRADDAVVTGDLILGAFSMAADSSNVCSVFIAYPSVTDLLG